MAHGHWTVVLALLLCSCPGHARRVTPELDTPLPPNTRALLQRHTAVEGLIEELADDCASVWSSPACKDGQCYPCGARIDWLRTARGYSEEDARRAVAEEIPDPCGPCKPDPCKAQLQNRACHGTECYTCLQRITWLSLHGHTLDEAKAVVAAEFPQECGACGPTSTLAATPAPTPPPTPAPTPLPTVVMSPDLPVTDCAWTSEVCNVPAGFCATLEGHAFCAHVEVQGSLTLLDGSRLTATTLHVERQGTLRVGSREAPARDVEINLQESGELLSEGQVYIHGKEKTSWTTLSAPCDHCQTISVHACKGWEVGDSVVLVGTGSGHNGFVEANHNYRTDERKILSMSGCDITLDQPAHQKHRCEMYKGRVNITSEVLNMNRTVRIFGSAADFANGIRVRQQNEGAMQIHYTRVSHCGQRKLGQYCLHWHHVGPCPLCSFVGNAIGNPSVSKAITIHGTSDALIAHNVVYNHRGAFLYVEDGNEVGNHINNNALICPRKAPYCVLHDGIFEHRSADRDEQAGMYVVGATNNFIGNHIAGMENAFYHDFQSGMKVWGGGDPQAANTEKKICPAANPFRKVAWNYFHNNQGFGFYHPHSSFPTRVQTDSNGYVTDWTSCLGFDPVTGEDNSAETLVENHVEIFHNFGAGGYDGGETSFRNSVFAFGLAANYYKSFRRGVRTGPFCEGCFYTNNLHPFGPGGSCMFEYKDTVFEDTLYGLNVNHHCGNNGEWTGGLCASHFWFTGSSEWKGTFKIKNDGFSAARGYSDTIVYLKGNTYFSTLAAHPAFQTSDCQTSQAGGEWTSCSSGDIRIVRIYSSNRGPLAVRNNDEGYSISVPYTPWQKTQWWGRPNAYDLATVYQNGGMGYTFLVKAGQSYTLTVHEGSDLPDLFTLEYSDVQMPEDSIKLSVEGSVIIAGGLCEISSKHKRSWISPYGPYLPQSGAWWDCARWPVQYTIEQHAAAQNLHFSKHGVQMQ